MPALYDHLFGTQTHRFVEHVIKMSATLCPSSNKRWRLLLYPFHLNQTCTALAEECSRKQISVPGPQVSDHIFYFLLVVECFLYTLGSLAARWKSPIITTVAVNNQAIQDQGRLSWVSPSGLGCRRKPR